MCPVKLANVAHFTSRVFCHSKWQGRENTQALGARGKGGRGRPSSQSGHPQGSRGAPASPEPKVGRLPASPAGRGPGPPHLPRSQLRGQDGRQAGQSPRPQCAGGRDGFLTSPVTSKDMGSSVLPSHPQLQNRLCLPDSTSRAPRIPGRVESSWPEVWPRIDRKCGREAAGDPRSLR